MKLKTGKKSGLKYFNIEDVRSYRPCYDPIKHLAVDKRYTALDILKDENISHNNKLWLVLRTDIVSEKVMRLFAVWASRQVLKNMPNDDRLTTVLDVAEKFANGNATAEELSAAWNAAWNAANAAWSAANAAKSAAWSAAWNAAESAAESAYNAAKNAAESAAESASNAAWNAAWNAAESAQLDKLYEMIRLDGLERIKNKPGGK